MTPRLLDYATGVLAEDRPGAPRAHEPRGGGDIGAGRRSGGDAAHHPSVRPSCDGTPGASRMGHERARSTRWVPPHRGPRSHHAARGHRVDRGPHRRWLVRARRALPHRCRVRRSPGVVGSPPGAARPPGGHPGHLRTSSRTKNPTDQRKGIMNDGFCHKAWQFALLFAVIAMLAAAIVVQQGDLSPADVREIIAAEGLTGGDGAAAYPTDQSIRPTLTPIAQLAVAPADEVHVTYAPEAPPPPTGPISQSGAYP